MDFALAIPIKRSTYNLLSVLVKLKYLRVEEIDLVFVLFSWWGEEERRCENKVVKTRWGEGAVCVKFQVLPPPCNGVLHHLPRKWWRDFRSLSA